MPRLNQYYTEEGLVAGEFGLPWSRLAFVAPATPGDKSLTFKLGQKVTFDRVLVRATGHLYSETPNAFWRRLISPEPRTGVVVGLRTVFNGKVIWDGHGHTFKHGAPHRAVVVAWHLHRRPFLVLPEDLQPEEEAEV